MRTNKKSTIKSKSPVHLRTKPLANGNLSFYLDINTDGKRVKEYLRLYIVPEKTPIDKINNANTQRAAEAICAQRILDIANGKANITPAKEKAPKMLLIDWLKAYGQDEATKGKPEMQRLINRVIGVILEYKGKKVTMSDVDKDFILGYIDYLSNVYKTQKSTKATKPLSKEEEEAKLKRAKGKKHPKPKPPRPLAKSTQRNYCAFLCCALNEAVRKGALKENPFNLLDRSEKIKAPQSTREYLSIEEIKKLIATDCARPQIKMAYLFSVYCGLRISDIRALKWSNIVNEDGQPKINIIIQKTKTPISIPLSGEAQKWLPEKGETKDDDKIFVLPASVNLSVGLDNWAKKAGIKKHVTFHTARHTFATMMLTLGADLYTTSKLLGHANVATTQIYAKIVDKKKIEAVNLVDGLFN